MKMNDIKYSPTIKRKSSASAPYETSDLYLSAFLKTNGVILQSINRKNGKVYFVFQNKGDIEELVNKYFNDAYVSVLSYKAALRDLRSIIFDYPSSLSAKENQNG